MRRQEFLSFGAAALSGFVIPPIITFQSQDSRLAAYKATWVKEFVGARHNDLDKVKEMLANHPNLLNAFWDWGAGDFELAIGGAGHVSNKEIANYLIEKGARINVYVMTMLGLTEIGVPTLEKFPSLLQGNGPHGFTLLHHAKVGGDDALEVLIYLESKGLTEKNENFINICLNFIQTMKIQNLLLILIAITFLACQTEKSTAIESNVSPILNNYNEEKMQLFPLEATYKGDNRYNDQLPIDIGDEHRQNLRTFYQKYTDQLSGLHRETLNSDEQMSYDILKWECQNALEGLEFQDHLMPINQFWSMPLTIGQLASGSSSQPFKTAKDYRDWLSRLDSFVQWCEVSIENMRKGIAEGYVLPKSLTLKVIPQMDALDNGPVEDHLFFSPINNMPKEIGAEERQELTDAYTNIIENKIIPAFKSLYEFFQNEYLPASRETDGISEVPGGKVYYDHMIKHYTTTTMSADEIFDIGISEVERIKLEMDIVKNQVGFEGDLKSFIDHVRENPKLKPFTDAQQVIDHFNSIHEKMKPNLKRLFNLTPKTAFEVRRTEAFREASASAEYSQGSEDGTRPGIFYVPVPDVRAYNIFTDEDLFLHEAIPGHHYQISLTQENEKLPDFRRTLWYSAYGEGWALYTESLGKELGLYDDPYQYFGMLSAEMHRAIRLVVDVGIHVKGWTREKAIEYSLENEAEPEASIIAEIERYMAIPAQALSYKIGQLKIRELRNRAESTLGDKFDVKEFHDQLLEGGCMPLKILEEKIDRWIASEK